MYDDPWSWTETKRPVAPLAASIQPAQEPVPGVVYNPQDGTEKQLQNTFMDKASKAGEKAFDAGVKAYKDTALTQSIGQSVAPLSANSVLGVPAPAMSLAPAATTAATEGLIASGIPGLAAPLASTTATGAGILGTEAAVGGALASTAAPAAAAAGTAGATGALGAGLGAGASAGLAALGPIGLLLGAGLLAKKLKLF
jgi:hypothetical protein